MVEQKEGVRGYGDVGQGCFAKREQLWKLESSNLWTEFAFSLSPNVRKLNYLLKIKVRYPT